MFLAKIFIKLTKSQKIELFSAIYEYYTSMLSVMSFLDVLAFITSSTFCTGESVRPKDVYEDCEILVCLFTMLTPHISNAWNMDSHLSPCVYKLQLIPLRKIKNHPVIEYIHQSPEMIDCSKNIDLTQNIQCILTSVIIEFYKLKGYPR
jgi:hypothetical protein